MDKRTFIKQATALGLSTLLPLEGMAHWIKQHENVSADVLAEDDKFWTGIRKGYRLKPDYINLENGYYCMQPQETLEHFIRHVREVNYQAAYYMRTVQQENKMKVIGRLAELAGSSVDEIRLTRNTTESLDTVINGIHWQAGDEAIVAEQDYGSIINMFKLMEKRYGIVLKTVSVPNHPTSDEEVVALYEGMISPKTRLLLVSHMVNITGQILPIRKISDMAHAKGVEVLVDGAHAFAHFQFKIPDLGCDYYGASLHKWLSTPLGAGLLYIKQGKAPGLWSLMADWNMKDDISHLAHTGTHPVHTDLAILNAIDYYKAIGPERKEKRLRYLQHYWTSKVRDMPHIILNTPEDPARSCAIANVGVKGMKPTILADTLLKKHGIYTVAIDGAGVQGCRITPNIYTTTQELDIFIKALSKLTV